MVHDEIRQFFDRMPEAFPLYEAVAKEIANFGHVDITVQKSQIKFSNKHGFAFVWLPINRRIKGRPGVYIVVTFGLEYQLNDPRIAESVEPYPNRWTHHVVVQNVDEVDEQLINWLKEAYDFALSK